MAAPMYNVYAGSETGLIKGINSFKGFWDNLNSIKTPDKTKEVRCLSWTDNSESQICIGLKEKSVTIFDVSDRTFSNPFHLDGGEGNLCNVVKMDDSYINAIDTGAVHIWRDMEQIAKINTGENLHCMTTSQFDRNIIGTGGKETELKLWDVNSTDTATFVAKNVKNDWLNLRVPVWVMGIKFLDENRVVTCTGHHQVRVYDPKSQRRPVLDMKFDEYPLTAMSVFGDNQVIVGNTQGKMALLDIRKGQMVHIYKGFSGAIRSLQCHPNKPVVASCGLDRFLRLHDINTKEMLRKIYLKSRLNCLLLSKQWQSDEGGTKYREPLDDIDEEVDDDEENASESDEDVWGNMEVVQTRTVKSSKKGDGNNDSDRKRKGKTVAVGDKKKKISKT